MRNRCPGCGAKIQFEDEAKVGYISSDIYYKNPSNFYCKRCYDLIHYNRNTKVKISNEDFTNNIAKLKNKKILIVNIVDVFDLAGSIVKNINQLFPKASILLVFNKLDLLPKSVKLNKLKENLNKYLLSNNIIVDKSLIISSTKNNDIIKLANEIEKLSFEKDIYFFGITNVGKSTIINKLINYKKINIPSITVSNSLSTTLDLVKIPFSNGSFIYDMPGIVNESQLTNYLDFASLKLLEMKKEIKPLIYQLNPEQALFLGGVAKVLFTSGKRSSFVLYMPRELVIHRTKLENATKFFELHKDDILKIPNETERENLGSLVSHQFKIDEATKKDIVISGLGFITVLGDANITIETYEKIEVKIREAII